MASQIVKHSDGHYTVSNPSVRKEILDLRKDPSLNASMAAELAADNKAKMERFLRGESPRPDDSGWYQSNVKFNPKEVIRRGTLTVNGTEVLYSASRGEIERRHGEDKHGIVTMVMPECPHDSRLRFGMWFGPDPDPEKPLAETSFAGTNADPAALQDFLGHFQLCGK